MLALYTLSRSCLLQPHVVLLSAANIRIFEDAASHTFFVCAPNVNWRSRVTPRRRGSGLNGIIFPSMRIFALHFASRVHVVKSELSDLVAFRFSFHSLLQSETTSTVFCTLLSASAIVSPAPCTPTSSAKRAFRVSSGSISARLSI